MQNVDSTTVADSIDQAAIILAASYERVVAGTDPSTFKVSGDVFKHLNYDKTLKSLMKIGVMCRRLEFELREHHENGDSTSTD